MWFHLGEETEAVKFMEADGRMAVTENLGEGKRGIVINGIEFQFRKKKKVLEIAQY